MTTEEMRELFDEACNLIANLECLAPEGSPDNWSCPYCDWLEKVDKAVEAG